MLEIYLYYLAFAGQILLLSVVFPHKYLRCVKASLDKHLTPDRLELAPEALGSITAAIRTYYRLNLVITLGGFILMYFNYRYVQNNGWTETRQIYVSTLFFFVQFSPFSLVARQLCKFGILIRKKLPMTTRTAVLQRRSVFDFVPPTVVFLTALGYPALVALSLYLMQKGSFPDYKSYSLIAAVTFMYLATIITIQVKLHGKKSNPLQSPADQKLEIGAVVRISVYTCMVGMIFITASIALKQYGLMAYMPAFSCLFYIFCAWLYIKGLDPVDPDKTGNNGHNNGSLASGKA